MAYDANPDRGAGTPIAPPIVMGGSDVPHHGEDTPPVHDTTDTAPAVDLAAAVPASSERAADVEATSTDLDLGIRYRLLDQHPDLSPDDAGLLAHVITRHAVPEVDVLRRGAAHWRESHALLPHLDHNHGGSVPWGYQFGGPGHPVELYTAVEDIDDERVAGYYRDLNLSPADALDEIVRLRRDHLHACQTIAAMHRAAVGPRKPSEHQGPIRGVVEDVADMRQKLMAAREALHLTPYLFRTDDYAGPEWTADVLRDTVLMYRHLAQQGQEQATVYHAQLDRLAEWLTRNAIDTIGHAPDETAVDIVLRMLDAAKAAVQYAAPYLVREWHAILGNLVGVVERYCVDSGRAIPLRDGGGRCTVHADEVVLCATGVRPAQCQHPEADPEFPSVCPECTVFVPRDVLPRVETTGEGVQA